MTVWILKKKSFAFALQCKKNLSNLSIKFEHNGLSENKQPVHGEKSADKKDPEQVK